MSDVIGSKSERSNALFDTLSFVPVELIRLISEYTVSELGEFWEVSILPLLKKRCDIFPDSVQSYGREEIDSDSWIENYSFSYKLHNSSPGSFVLPEVVRVGSQYARDKPNWKPATFDVLMDKIAVLQRRKRYHELPSKPKSWSEFDRLPLPSATLEVSNQLHEQLTTAASDFALDLEWSVDECWCFRLVPKYTGSGGGDRAVQWIELLIVWEIDHKLRDIENSIFG